MHGIALHSYTYVLYVTWNNICIYAFVLCICTCVLYGRKDVRIYDNHVCLKYYNKHNITLCTWLQPSMLANILLQVILKGNRHISYYLNNNNIIIIDDLFLKVRLLIYMCVLIKNHLQDHLQDHIIDGFWSNDDWKFNYNGKVFDF